MIKRMKHVLVTGGARGIGRAIVEELAEHKYQVTATYFGSKAAADAISKKYSNVTFVKVDLTDRKALDTFIEQQLYAKPLDVLVNNAGVYIGKDFTILSEDELYQQADLMFAAPARLTQGLLPAFKKAKAPLVINISSQAAYAQLTGEAVYSAAKAAISTLSRVLRAELNPRGIRVTAVEPFGVNTYGIDEPSSMVLPQELAQQVRSIIELPDHLQIDNLGISHINQTRPDYPDWIAR